MTNDKSFTYQPVCHYGRWMIEATDDLGDTLFMTCGLAPSLDEVRERIRWLLMDDDKIDAGRGAPRKFQS